MLRYLIVFLTFFLVTTFVLVQQYKTFYNSIISVNIKNNAKNLSKAFTNLIWIKYSFILDINDYNIQKWKLSPQSLKFDDESRLFFKNLGLLQVEIFSKYDDKLFSLKNYSAHNHHASNHDLKKSDSSMKFDKNGNIIIALPLMNSTKSEAFIELTYNIKYAVGNLKIQFYKFFIIISFLILSFISWMLHKLYRSSTTLNEQFIINAKLKSAKESIEKISLQKSQFLANVSHELKTPLNAILGFSDLIKNSHNASKELKDYANDIYNSGSHLLNLINDILDFSKSEVNKLQIRFDIFDLIKLINNCIRMTTSNLPKLKVNANFFSEKLLIKLDHKRMKQVLLNILSNAVKFTDKTGIINIDVKKDIHWIIIKISDNEIGRAHV